MPLSVGGAVYGVILNDRPSLEALGDTLEQPPYKGAPKAPVLYIKPANTHAAPGARIAVPGVVEIGATVGMVAGRPAARLAEGNALDALDGLCLVADLSLPHASVYRPAIREKCWDASCPIGPLHSLPGPVREDLEIRTFVDGKLVHAWPLSRLVRSMPRLLADVTAFMTLRPGDMLLAGFPTDVAQAGPGARIAIEADGLGRLDFTLTGETA